MQQNIMLIFTLMLSGRAMTLAYIHRVGGTMPGDPPAAWLMPLLARISQQKDESSLDL